MQPGPGAGPWSSLLKQSPKRVLGRLLLAEVRGGPLLGVKPEEVAEVCAVLVGHPLRNGFAAFPVSRRVVEFAILADLQVVAARGAFRGSVDLGDGRQVGVAEGTHGQRIDPGRGKAKPRS